MPAASRLSQRSLTQQTTKFMACPADHGRAAFPVLTPGRRASSFGTLLAFSSHLFMHRPSPVDSVSTRGIFMAARSFESLIDLPDLTSEPLADSSRTVSGIDPDGDPDINLGAFRGLGYALVIESALVIIGSAGWMLWHILR